MYMVEISEQKVENLSEHLEKGLRYIGKAMQCIDELKSEHFKDRMPAEHYGYGERIHREGRDRIWEEHDLGERIGRGRYSRY